MRADATAILLFFSLFYFSLFFPTATHATATHAGGPIGAVYPGCDRLGSCRCFPLLQVGVSSKKGAPKTLAVRAKGRRKSFEYDATTGTGTSTVVIDIIDIIDRVSQGRSLAIPHLPCTVRYYVLGAPTPPGCSHSCLRSVHNPVLCPIWGFQARRPPRSRPQSNRGHPAVSRATRVTADGFERRAIRRLGHWQLPTHPHHTIKIELDFPS